MKQAVRQLTSYVEELRAELAMKDETIVSLQKELSRTETSFRQDRLVPKTNSSVKASTASAQHTFESTSDMGVYSTLAFILTHLKSTKTV